MLLPDPAEMSGVEWQVGDATRRLAALIANAAIEDPTAIPEELIAAYHDILQLHQSLVRTNKMATAIAMSELSKRCTAQRNG